MDHIKNHCPVGDKSMVVAIATFEDLVQVVLLIRGFIDSLTETLLVRAAKKLVNHEYFGVHVADGATIHQRKK